MKHIPYEEKKSSYDKIISLYFLNRSFEDFDDTDAFKEGLIDGVGATISKPTNQNSWSMTIFDKLVMYIKQNLGEDKLKEVFKDFSWVSKIDPYYLMNLNTYPDFKKIIKGWELIISKTEDTNFLPNNFERNSEDNYSDSKEESNSFKSRLSFSITIFSFLLNSMLEKKIPNSIDFKFNVLPSVETTFWLTPFKEYEEVIKFCKENELVDNYNKITNKGIRLIKSISNISKEYNLLNSSVDRIENKHNIIIKLASI